jgi:hypothetical protein
LTQIIFFECHTYDKVKQLAHDCVPCEKCFAASISLF